MMGGGPQRSEPRCARNRRGAAVVEFAIIAPLFLFIVFAVIEFGRMVMVQQVITNASREGARRAVLDGVTSGEVLELVEEYLTRGSVQGGDVTITPDPPSEAAFGEPVTVTVSVPFDQVSWLPAPMFLQDATMTATTVMRRESVQ